MAWLHIGTMSRRNGDLYKVLMHSDCCKQIWVVSNITIFLNGVKTDIYIINFRTKDVEIIH